MEQQPQSGFRQPGRDQRRQRGARRRPLFHEWFHAIHAPDLERHDPERILIYATAGGPSSNSTSLSTYAAINDANDIVYSALDTSGPSPVWTLKYQSSVAQISTVATLTGAQGLRPVISDNPFIVARVGDTEHDRPTR